jgi:hypothetical protein
VAAVEIKRAARTNASKVGTINEAISCISSVTFSIDDNRDGTVGETIFSEQLPADEHPVHGRNSKVELSLDLLNDAPITAAPMHADAEVSALFCRVRGTNAVRSMVIRRMLSESTEDS